MNFFSRMKMGIRFISTFGKPSDEATREKTTKKSIKNLLWKNDLEISKSEILSTNSKSFYIKGQKNESNSL